MKIALIVLVTMLAGAIAYPAALPAAEQDAVPEEQGIWSKRLHRIYESNEKWMTILFFFLQKCKLLNMYY